jgi:hypothetical protein
MKIKTGKTSTDGRKSPDIRYHKTRQEFDLALGRDFIETVNKVTKNGQRFFGWTFSWNVSSWSLSIYFRSLQ